MEKRFTNKVVIVTGACRGIGQEVALTFAREGAHVVSLCVSDPSELKSKITALGVKCTAISEDFSKLNQKRAAEVVAHIIKEAGHIDVLVNNAGIIKRAPIVDHSEADWQTVLQVNLSAPFFLTQAVCKWWLTTGRAHAPADARLKIVNVASMLSFQGGILVPGYTASKSGMAGITKAFANELAKERVNCNAIAPGYIATENTKALREDVKRNESILARIPETRWGDPKDIAGPILFLASKEADYMNGTIMNVDGGWLSR
ncbi:MAG TPA: SDR family NAD(P)-dependent oxidoreductase [Verrucomicrobiae bacterium]|jgi:2-deoxy-D-gluconate 3-dehydrogenase|nr:SDR family NAD(P)-dependent oxidoreductase [Verrucomicrobiae bacterium]